MICPGAARKLPDFASVQRIVLHAGFIALAAGCSQTSVPPPLPRVATVAVLVNPPQLTLQAGGTVQLAAEANDASGQPIGGARFRYTPADQTVLQVSNHGLVTALGPAASNTEVVVESDRAEQRVPVVVRPGPPQQIEKLGGDRQQLRAGEAPEPLSARVLDAWGNPIADLPLSIEPAAVANASSDPMTSADGTVHIELPSLTTAGTVVVALHARGLRAPAASFALNVAPGAPAHLRRLPGFPASATTGHATVTERLLVTDAFDNPIPDVAVRARSTKWNSNPLPARTGADGIAVISLPRSPPSRRVTVKVELVDSPAVHASFEVAAPPR